WGRVARAVCGCRVWLLWWCFEVCRGGLFRKWKSTADVRRSKRLKRGGALALTHGIGRTGELSGWTGGDRDFGFEVRPPRDGCRAAALTAPGLLSVGQGACVYRQSVRPG